MKNLKHKFSICIYWWKFLFKN